MRTTCRAPERSPFRGDSAFSSWFYRVVANAAYQWLRKRRGRSADVSLETVLPVFDQHGRHPEAIADWSMSIDDPARQTELRMTLSAAIEELPADYRIVIVLRDVEGLSYQEIAEALGLRVSNVKTRLHRAPIPENSGSTRISRWPASRVCGTNGSLEASEGRERNGRRHGEQEQTEVGDLGRL